MTALALGACQENSDLSITPVHEEMATAEREQAVADEARAQTVQTTSLSAQSQPGGRAPVLIRRAELALRVTDYDEAAEAVPRIVGRFDAYLAGEQEVRHAFRISNTYTIRVAAPQFDSL